MQIDKEFGYNSFLFRIPIYNLFHPFLDGQSETPAWPVHLDMFHAPLF